MVVAVCVATVLAGCDLDIAPSETRSWLALGDSFSSGEGLPDAFDEPAVHRCQRSPSAYPLAAAARVDASPPFDPVTFLACTGATVAAMPAGSAPELTDSDSERQLKALRATDLFDVITMTFGGNDLHFRDVIVACLKGLATWYGAGFLIGGSLGLLIVNLRNGFCSIDRDKTLTQIAALEKRLTELYIKTATHLKGDGRLYVLGYPRLFAPSDVWPLFVKAGNTCEGVAAGDADLLGELADALNGTIEDAARAANAVVKVSGRVVSYVRVDDLYATHERCGTDTPWINGFPTVDLEDRGSFVNRLRSSFHPNADGHSAEAARVASRVESHLGSAK